MSVWIAMHCLEVTSGLGLEAEDVAVKFLGIAQYVVVLI